MKHPLALALTAALSTLALAACNAPAPSDAAVAKAPPAAPVATSEAVNPFFADSPLPLHYPQFDKIKDSDFAPAFDRGMAEEIGEDEAIANSPDAPTFENTIVAMEKGGRILGRASRVFFNLVGADTNEARKKIQTDYAPKLAAHQDAIYLNPKLFERVQKLFDTRNDLGLDPEGVRLIERYHDDFVRAGGWKGAREQGLARAEGKEYVVRDGDVLLFRFNV